MDYRRFEEEMREMVQKKMQESMGGEVCVSCKEVLKNNGVRNKAFCIRMGREAAAPVIYTEDLYERHLAGISVEECAKAAIRACLNGEENAAWIGGVAGIAMDWGQAKTRVYPYLISRKWNQEFFAGVAWKPFLDLAVCYMIRVEDADGMYFKVNICNTHLQAWGINQEELERQAWENLGKDGLRIQPIGEVVAGMEGAEEAMAALPVPMYILTNRDGRYGAAGVLDKKLLRGLADREGMNLYLLPSSVHEFILLLDDGQQDAEALGQMVAEINQIQVLPEERLEDHAYYYDRKADEIRIAGERL